MVDRCIIWPYSVESLHRDIYSTVDVTGSILVTEEIVGQHCGLTEVY